jgi:hypothetical protein
MKGHSIFLKGRLNIVLILGIITLLLVSSTSIGMRTQTSTLNTGEIPYEGTLRIYIVEPISRWNNHDNEPYYYGFLDFAFNDAISMNYQETYTNSITWDGFTAGYGDIQENNIMVIATLFNPEIHIGYSYPPMKSPFEAHYVDACTAATPGKSGSNTVDEEFTHTVFVEEATAQYCPYCPAMADALNTIYESGEYPFYFTAFVTKDLHGNTLNQVALDYLSEEYNLAAYPSAYFDGGYKTLVGGYDNPDTYITRIQRAVMEETHDVDFTISVSWLGDANLKIDVSITNNEELFNEPPGAPTITGPTSGKIGEEYSYQISAEDPDNNDLYYYIDWGDGTDVELFGPYTPGRTATVKHNWSEKGEYTIQVMSRDTYDTRSDWVSLDISMHKQKTNMVYVQTLFEKYLKMIGGFTKFF